MEDNGDDAGSKLSRKGNGSAEVGAKRAVHDNGLWTASCVLRTASCVLLAVSCATTDCGLCTADCELCYRLQAVDCALWSWFPSDVSLGV